MAFFIIICLLVWKVADLRGKISLIHDGVPNQDCELYKYFFGKIIPEFSLRSLEGKSFSAYKNKNTPFYLFIFFTPWDCQPCFDEVAFWQELRNRFQNRIEIVAIGTANSIELLRHFIEKNRITIYTLYDENEELFKTIGLKDMGLTPIKFLTNSRGVILHISMSIHKDELMQKQYLELLTRIVT
jgi:peroxiredoxin